MAAPLSVCTKEEQRAVIQFLWAEGVPGAEIYRRLLAQYGNSFAAAKCVRMDNRIKKRLHKYH
jgi:hypothetical protein